MKNKIFIFCTLILSVFVLSGCALKDQTELKVLNKVNNKVDEKIEEVSQETSNNTDTETELQQQLNADQDNDFSSELNDL